MSFFSGLWLAFCQEAKGYTRIQYSVYLLRRVLEALLVASLGALLLLYLQAHHYWRPASLRWFTRLWSDRPPHAVLVGCVYVQWYWWPFVTGLVSYLVLGPKQKRPIHLRIPGIMYRYAGVNVDRNAGCRGGAAYGSTGSGKTIVCINPRNHSIMINECGVEKRSWHRSKARVRFEELRRTFREQTADVRKRIDHLVRERERLADIIEPIQDRVVDELFTAINEYQRRNPDRPFTATVFQVEDPDAVPPEVRFKQDATATPDDAVRLLTWIRNANRFGLLDNLPDIGSTALQENLRQYAELVAQDNALDAELNNLLYLLQVKRNDLQKFADGIKALRYKVPPVGCLGIGAKGNEWQAAVPMLTYYNRDEDICLLQTRPDNAPDGWTPPACFNLLSYDSLPAPTYAQILFATYMTISQKSEMDFFENAARDQIGFGIALLRAIRDAQIAKNVPPEQRVIPNLTLLCEIFTTLQQYKQFMVNVGAATEKKEVPYFEDERQPDGTMKKVQKVRQVTPLPYLRSPKIDEARQQIEGGYWALPDETLKGVMGSIRNVLIPFTERDVAEVFCGINTFDLRETEFGKCVYIAMPPKFSVQRQYVGTILKNLMFTLINERFALREDSKEWVNRNLVLIDSDEHQISAGKEDERVDVIRQASGTLYIATQMRDSVWKTYGGKEKGYNILNNLRNVWATQAASENCAKETSTMIGTGFMREHSYSSGRKSGGTTTSYRERAFVTAGQLTALSPFFVYWIPAEGKWLYRLVIAMPITPSGGIPHWWFGDWNILHWLARFCFLPPALRLGSFKLPFYPEGMVFPWRAKAPLRAQVYYLLGLDGTFIRIRSMRRKHAERMARPETER